MAGPLSVALLASLALVPVPSGLEATNPYKVEGAWSYFINDNLCTAGMVQLSDNAVLMMAFDASKKSFLVSFTEKRKAAIADSQREMGIRLHRTSGALDEGWEDVWFTPLSWTEDSLLWVSQPMEEVALHDFNDYDTLVFIDHGRTAGMFRGKGNQAAVRELRRCAKEQKAKN